MSYFGLNLMLQYAVPIALATIAQMFIITVNDLDLSIGAVRRAGRLHRRAPMLDDTPLLGLAALAALHRRLCRASARSSICATCPRSW